MYDERRAVVTGDWAEGATTNAEQPASTWIDAVAAEPGCVSRAPIRVTSVAAPVIWKATALLPEL